MVVRFLILFNKRNLNLRKKRWLELLEDNAMTIVYHLGNTDVIVEDLG